jgi:hypothetical protein
LPADFETFGQAVATSMADLLGVTTGQVLSKASNTNMDFTWVTSDDANAIQNTIVDAKGDLIGATAADTPARLAVGTNGQVLTADSTAATGLAWATPTSTAFVGCSLENGSISIANNTDTYLTFSSELYDTDAMHSTSSNTSRITIPTGKGGYYEFKWSMVWDNNTTNNRRVRLVKNGSTYENGPILTIRGVGLTGLSNSTVVSTVAGDYWELQAFQDCGGALNVGVGGGIMFQANKVG